MSLEIRNQPLFATLTGRSGVHDAAKCYGDEIRALLDPVWAVIRSRKLKHKGINWVVYDPGCRMFAGVEVDADPAATTELETRVVHLPRYAAWKHIGPYNLIGQAGDAMRQAITGRGLQLVHPYIEVYGHWNDDPTKLETDLIHALG